VVVHIAFWSPGWPLENYHNGIVTYVHSMKRELEGLGHRVSVFTANKDESVTDPRVHRVRRGRWSRLVRSVAGRMFPIDRDIANFGRVVAAGILTVHRRDPIDIIEMEESFGWAADVGRLTSIPVLVKLHGPAFLSLVEEELATPAGRSRVDREGAALARAAAIASPTALTLSQTIERYRLTPKLRQHIVNPLNMDADTPMWELDNCDPHRIMFVGRFDRRKGADVVLHAFELLLRTRPQLKLVFVGPDVGLLQADGHRIHFKSYVQSLLPAETLGRVEFRGRMAHRDIARLRVEAMVTVVASRWENPGYTALEAMFQGCPLVCSDADACREIVSHGVTGRLARSGLPASFAAEISAILDHPEQASQMAAAARRYVLDQHAARKVADESLDLYRRVIASVRTSAHAEAAGDGHDSTATSSEATK
jgi:glycosyltransferase involved in cell wall biosynthesis